MPSLSLSVWGAWIEILFNHDLWDYLNGRSPYGERGLKLKKVVILFLTLLSRSPYGERGLK